MKGQSSVWADPHFGDTTNLDVDESGWAVFGWSKGYVAFDQVLTDTAAGPWTLVTMTANSTDGLHWMFGAKFTVTGISTIDPGHGDGISSVAEGPAGLMAVGRGSAEDCRWGTYEWPVAVSTDGITWTPVPAKVGSGTVTKTTIQAIHGGSTGYIATGTNGVYMSTDGVTWKTAEPTSHAGIVGIESGASFAGGFVISGEANKSDQGGCGGSSAVKKPSLAWSPDGRTWTIAQVPGLPDSANEAMYVCGYGDHTLVAGVQRTDGTDLEWSSVDGRTWTRLPASSVVLCPQRLSSAFRTIGGRTVVLSEDALSRPSIYLVGNDLGLVQLKLTGDVPPGWSVSDPVLLGPAGLVEIDDFGNTYIGLPGAN